MLRTALPRENVSVSGVKIHHDKISKSCCCLLRKGPASKTGGTESQTGLSFLASQETHFVVFTHEISRLDQVLPDV